MTDVANLAGVSHQTVSRVVNDSPKVRPETRARVLAAIDDLGYSPSTVAKALATGRSQTVGVVSTATNRFGPASTLAAIEQAASDAGYFVSIAMLGSINASSIERAVERLRRQQVEGILLATPIFPVAGSLSSLFPLPLVSIQGGPPSLPTVAVDNSLGGFQATEHLLELGHGTVRHIAGPLEWLEARNRMAGWQQALELRGRQILPPLQGDWTSHSGYKQGLRLADDPRTTAIFVANDQMAIGAMAALHERGRRVPDEVSVVGFDDIPEAAYLVPSLTTVRQDFDALGRQSLEVLLRTIANGDGGDTHVTLPAEFTVRASSSPPPN